MTIRTSLVAGACAAVLLASTGCAVTRGQESVGAYVDDAAITTAVKARFVDNAAVDASSIRVETLNGTVMLSGFAMLGAAGADVYLFGRGGGIDLVRENDAAASVVDRVQFSADVLSTDVSFVRVGNNLEARINASADKIVVQDWYLGAAYQLEQFNFGGGAVLSAAQIEGRATLASTQKGSSSGQYMVSSPQATFALMLGALRSMGDVMSGQMSMAAQAQAILALMAGFGAGGRESAEVRTERIQPWFAPQLAAPVL